VCDTNSLPNYQFTCWVNGWIRKECRFNLGTVLRRLATASGFSVGYLSPIFVWKAIFATIKNIFANRETLWLM
jgi:hypothetical protein